MRRLNPGSHNGKIMQCCLVYQEKKKSPKRAMMRYAFSAETRTIYESLNLSTEDRKDPEKVMKAMEEFAKGILNETLERHHPHTYTTVGKLSAAYVICMLF